MKILKGNGIPDRVSPAIQLDNKFKTYEGLIKIRLAHSIGKSYLIPDLIIGLSGTRYFLPSFFDPPCIAFNIEPNFHAATFSVDVGNPRAKTPTRLFVSIKSTDCVKSYDDGAQLYKCEFVAPRKILELVTGQCKKLANGDYAIKAFHHTTNENAKRIKYSKELWSSSWNLAGTRELENVAYSYFTSLSKIKDENDLRCIAMASNEVLELQTTSNREKEKILELKVYRGDTKARTVALPFFIPTEIISPYPLRFHLCSKGNPAYYECVMPEVIRVGLKPTKSLSINEKSISLIEENKKSFNYVVLGDAEDIEGLEAPYKEDDTKKIALLQKLDDQTDFFSFWLENSNSDQVSDREIEPRLLKELK